jgi:hypothetical protein
MPGINAATNPPPKTGEPARNAQPPLFLPTYLSIGRRSPTVQPRERCRPAPPACPDVSRTESATFLSVATTSVAAANVIPSWYPAMDGQLDRSQLRSRLYGSIRSRVRSRGEDSDQLALVLRLFAFSPFALRPCATGTTLAQANEMKIPLYC